MLTTEKEMVENQNFDLAFQSNNNVCGVFVLHYCLQLLNINKDRIISHTNVKLLRKWIGFVLLNLSIHENVHDVAITCDTIRWTLRLLPFQKKKVSRGDFIIHEIQSGNKISENAKIHLLKLHNPHTIEALNWLRQHDDDNVKHLGA